MTRSIKVVIFSVVCVVGLLALLFFNSDYYQRRQQEQAFVESMKAMSEGRVPDAMKGREKNKLSPDVENILEKTDHLFILALDPRPVRLDQQGRESTAAQEIFHGYRIRKKVEVVNGEKRKFLLQALYRGVAANQGIAAACFNPRHGISAEFGGKTANLVICFECLQIEIHGSINGGVLVSRYPEKAFDEALASL